MSALMACDLSLRSQLLAATALVVIGSSSALAAPERDAEPDHAWFDPGRSINFAYAEPFEPASLIQLRSLAEQPEASTTSSATPQNVIVQVPGGQTLIVDTPTTVAQYAVAGTLIIDDAPVTVTNNVLIRPFGFGGVATVHVTGPNAVLDTPEIRMTEPSDPSGTQFLRLSNGATISADRIITGTSQLGSTLTIIIGGEDNGVLAEAGVFDVDQISIGDLGVSVIFNHASDDFVFSTASLGGRNSRITVEAGTTTMTQDQSVGRLTVQGGTLIAEQDLALDFMDIAGGVLVIEDTLSSRQRAVVGGADGGALVVDGGLVRRSNIGTTINELTVFGANGATGRLQLSNNGRVELGRVVLNNDAGGTAQLVYGGEVDGQLSPAGQLDVGAIQISGENTQIVFDHTNTGFIFDETLTTFSAAPRLTNFVVRNGRTSFGQDYTVRTVRIEGGTLLIGESLNADTLTLTGGELGGLGQINADILVGNGAQITPGSASGEGTLNVMGDVSFDGGSILQTSVRTPDDGNLLAIDGALQLNGGEVRVEGFDQALDPITFDINLITATGGVNGAFDTLTADFAFYNASLVYQTNAVVLRLMRNQAEFTDFAVTSNQDSVARALEEMDITDPLVSSALMLSEGAIPVVFDSLTGEAHASIRVAAFRSSDGFADAIYGRALEPGQSGIWFSVQAEDARLGADAISAAATRETRGGALGGDIELGGFRLGLAGAFQSSDLDVEDRSTTGEMDSWQLGAYGFGDAGPVALSFSAAYINHDITTERTPLLGGFEQALTADYQITGTQLSGAASFDLLDCLAPFVGIHWTQLEGDAFSEAGSAAALDVAGFDDDLLRLELGIRANAGKIGLDGLTGQLSWRSLEGGDETDLAAIFGGQAIGVQGAQLDDSTIAAGLGYAAQLGDSVELGLRYGGEFGDNTNRHSLRLKARMNF